MKKLFENWRKYLTEENTDDTWYHTTHEITADAVEEQGIYTDHGGFVGGFTLGDHWADEIYEMRPVYLTKELGKSSTRPYDGVVFEVNVGDDILLPDLPSLADEPGANLELGDGEYDEYDEERDEFQRGPHVWWSDRDEVPEPLRTYMNNAGWGSPYYDEDYNDVYFKELVDGYNKDLKQAVINTTRTAVSTRGYTPDEIRRIGPVKAEDPDSDADDAEDANSSNNASSSNESPTKKRDLPGQFGIDLDDASRLLQRALASAEAYYPRLDALQQLGWYQRSDFLSVLGSRGCFRLRLAVHRPGTFYEIPDPLKTARHSKKQF